MINNKLALQKGLPKINEENHFSLVKLPLIDRPYQVQKKSLNKNKSGQLPTLNLQVTSLQDNALPQKDNQLNRHKHRPSIQQAKEVNSSNEFAHQIEQQLNRLLNKNTLLNSEYYTVDNEDFELSIQKNRELLKNRREHLQRESIKEESKDKPTESPKNNKSKYRLSPPKKDQIKSQNAELFRKKSRSSFLINRKEEVMKTQSDSLKSVSMLSNSKAIVMNQLEKKMKQLKNKLGGRKHESHKPSKLITEGDVEDVSQNLFDNIHNYLANPHNRSLKVLQKQPAQSKPQLNQKKVIQNKIKEIDSRLGLLSSYQSHKHSQKIDLGLKSPTSYEEYGVNDWRRVNLQGKGGSSMNLQESNFEREVTYLNQLQERNQHSLEKFLQNQRVLQQLKLHKSNSLKDKQFASK